MEDYSSRGGKTGLKLVQNDLVVGTFGSQFGQTQIHREREKAVHTRTVFFNLFVFSVSSEYWNLGWPP